MDKMNEKEILEVLRVKFFQKIDNLNQRPYSKKQIKDIFNEAFFEAVLDLLGNKEAKDAA